MIGQWHGWANSSAREEIQASGKSFQATLIRFGGEKKQMHSAAVEWPRQQLPPLRVFSVLYLFLLSGLSFTEIPHSKPKQARTPCCILLSPQHRELRSKQERKREGGRQGGRGGDPWLKFSGSGRSPQARSVERRWGRAEQNPSVSLPSISLDRQQPCVGNAARPRSSAAHKAGSSAAWCWSSHLENSSGIRHDTGKEGDLIFGRKSYVLQEGKRGVCLRGNTVRFRLRCFQGRKHGVRLGPCSSDLCRYLHSAGASCFYPMM